LSQLLHRYAPDAQNAPSLSGAKIQVKQMLERACGRRKRNKKESIWLEKQ